MEKWGFLNSDYIPLSVSHNNLSPSKIKLRPSLFLIRDKWPCPKIASIFSNDKIIVGDHKRENSLNESQLNNLSEELLAAVKLVIERIEKRDFESRLRLT